MDKGLTELLARPSDETLANRSANILGPSSAAWLAMDELERRREAGEAVDIWLVGYRWIVGPRALISQQQEEKS